MLGAQRQPLLLPDSTAFAPLDVPLVPPSCAVPTPPAPGGGVPSHRRDVTLHEHAEGRRSRPASSASAKSGLMLASATETLGSPTSIMLFGRTVGSRFDQQIVDAVAATHAALGVDASQGDVRTQVVPLYASAEDRRAFDVAIDALIPGELIRGGFPATPTLQLTPRGWLRSTRRDDVAVLVAAFLETYRAMAAARTLYEKPVTWADLSRSGASDASRGLLNTAGTRFGLFVARRPQRWASRQPGRWAS